MELYSYEAELRAILTISDRRYTYDRRIKWLRQLSAALFKTPVCVDTYQRIYSIATRRYTILNLAQLTEDQLLDQTVRDVLKSCDLVGLLPSEWDANLEILQKFAKVRAMYDMSVNTLEKLSAPTVDIDELLVEANNIITQASQDTTQAESFIEVGSDFYDQLVDEVLNEEKPDLLLTGFKEYDDRTGGLPSTGVGIAAATTSSGKSVLSMIMGKQMHMENKVNVVRITLEMLHKQETKRFMSHLSGVPFSRIRRAQMTAEDKVKIKKASAKMSQFSKEHNVKLVTWPTVNQTIDSALMACTPFKPKVIIIDYIGLLKGTKRNQDRWELLLDAAEQAKIYASQHNCFVWLMAQLKDGMELRHSEGMKDHCDVFWRWDYSKDSEARKTGIIEIDCAKDRDGTLGTLRLKEMFHVMDLQNVDENTTDNNGCPVLIDDSGEGEYNRYDSIPTTVFS